MNAPHDLKRLDALALLDVEALRLILLGNSVIDWQHLSFTQRDEVDHFLRLCGFEPDVASDQIWMRGMLDDAVAFARDTLRYRVPTQVAEPREIHDLFLYASGPPESELRKPSCIILKICHVIHHIEARDLFHRLPFAEEAFGQMAAKRVMAVFRQMRDAGFPIQEARASAKSRASIISKLLQKAETLAAEIYDRTRFRVVVAERSDVLPFLYGLTQRLFPFQLAVPGQTENSLIDFSEICDQTLRWAPFFAEPQQSNRRLARHNAASGSSFKMLKLVVDLPMRLEQRLISPEIAAATRARVVCSLVEIQIVDAATARVNEEGDNDHARYKQRQRQRVLRRLSRGLAP